VALAVRLRGRCGFGLRRWVTGAARRDPAIEIAVLERRWRWPSACADGVVFACADGVVFACADGVVFACADGVVFACADGVVFACADGVVFTRAGGRPARSALAGAVSTACYVLAFEQDVQLWYNT